MSDASAQAKTSISKRDFDQIAEELYKRNLELHKERVRTAELLYRVSEAIYATDEQCKITLFNHTLEKLLKINAPQALGQNVSEIIKLTDEKENPIDATTFCNIDGKRAEVPPLAKLKTKGKDHFVHIKISTIETENQSREFLVTMSDVTKEKELERAKDEFISITSHELRTPMTIIKSYLWMLDTGRGGDLNEKQRSYVQKASTGTERMIALINDMLNVSRMEQGRLEIKKESIDIRSYLDEITDELKVKTSEKNLYLDIEIEEVVQQIIVDKQKLREVIVNLVGNAAKFTTEGGITIKVVKEGRFTKFMIIDTGKGIEQDQMKRLFKKFQRVENTYQTMAETGGTGLGLYIVKLYISKMGGKVGAESEGINKGSTFWFTLPDLIQNKDK